VPCLFPLSLKRARRKSRQSTTKTPWGLDAAKCMWYYLFIPKGLNRMPTAVKKTISLPPDLAKEVEERARDLLSSICLLCDL
jgi:hypothetical protein